MTVGEESPLFQRLVSFAARSAHEACARQHYAVPCRGPLAEQGRCNVARALVAEASMAGGPVTQVQPERVTGRCRACAEVAAGARRRR